MGEQPEREQKIYPTSVRIVVHAMVSDGDVIGFLEGLKGSLKEMLKADVIKDVQLVEENVKIILPWNALKKELGMK